MNLENKNQTFLEKFAKQPVRFFNLIALGLYFAMLVLVIIVLFEQNKIAAAWSFISLALGIGILFTVNLNDIT